jgi:hypothetical protein
MAGWIKFPVYSNGQIKFSCDHEALAIYQKDYNVHVQKLALGGVEGKNCKGQSSAQLSQSFITL